MAKVVFSFDDKSAKKLKNKKNILGGKGANLGEMGRLGLPVPPGFTITTDVCDLFYKNKKKLPKKVIQNIQILKKYKSKLVCYINEAKRIPDIDIMVKDGEIWSENNFKAKITHIPGHTLGHICFHFFNEKNIFNVDTLFSL